jgi:glutaredoxin
MGIDPLVVFTADGCPHSRALCADLERRKVRFREANLSRDPAAMAALRSVCWERRLPVVLDHERLSIGFKGGSSSFTELGLE